MQAVGNDSQTPLTHTGPHFVELPFCDEEPVIYIDEGDEDEARPVEKALVNPNAFGSSKYYRPEGQPEGYTPGSSSSNDPRV